MRVFLTGATGQVGKAIAHRLEGQGYHVVGASRRFAQVPGVSEHVEAKLGAEDAVTRIKQAVSPCEAIVHAAASLSHKLYDAEVALTNCWGTQQIVELAHLWGVRQLVYISSVPVIGKPQQHPITEEHPVQPLTAYHASKLYGEHLMRLAERDDCRAVSLRLTSPCGPGTPPGRIMSVFVDRALAGQPLQLLGRGTRRQNYVDVRDIGQAVESCLRTAVSGLYNIAGAASTSNQELANACIAQLNSASIIEFLDRPDPEEGTLWDVAIEKAKRDLGYSPQFTVEESIAAIAYERSHRSAQ